MVLKISCGTQHEYWGLVQVLLLLSNCWNPFTVSAGPAGAEHQHALLLHLAAVHLSWVVLQLRPFIWRRCTACSGPPLLPAVQPPTFTGPSLHEDATFSNTFMQKTLMPALKRNKRQYSSALFIAVWLLHLVGPLTDFSGVELHQARLPPGPSPLEATSRRSSEGPLTIPTA